MANPRWLKARLADLVEVQLEVSLLEQKAIQSSGKTNSFPVDAQRKAGNALQRALHKKVRNQLEDFYHKLNA